MLKRLVQSLAMYAVVYAIFCGLEMLEMGEAKEIFFFTYLGVTVIFTSLVILPLINHKRIGRGQNHFDEKLMGILYAGLLMAVTALPILVSWVMSLLFSELDFFLSFAIFETMVYVAMATFYVVCCHDAEANEERYVVATKGNCISFEAEKRKRNSLWCLKSLRLK